MFPSNEQESRAVQLDIRIIQCIACKWTHCELGKMRGSDQWVVICSGCGQVSTLPDDNGFANVIAGASTKLTP